MGIEGEPAGEDEPDLQGLSGGEAAGSSELIPSPASVPHLHPRGLDRPKVPGTSGEVFRRSLINALHTRDYVFFEELLGSQPLYRVADQVFVLDDAIEALTRQQQDYLLQEEGELPEWLGRFVRSPGFRAVQERALRRLEQGSGLEGYGPEGLDG